MVNVKTKFDKRAIDNEKRRQSIKQKEKARLKQSLIIKQALSNANLYENSSKKVTFGDDDDINSPKTNDNKSTNRKSVLFDNSESDNEDIEITEKAQFRGKKGFELLNLQSTYGNDERFKIDERFLEDEKEDLSQGESEILNNGDAAGEKVKQLKILESVLGAPVIEPEKEGKLKKRTYEMLRYDASNKDHEVYEINTQPQTKVSMLSKKNKKRTELLKIEKQENNKPQVSKEKFYEVSSEIKNSFKHKKGDQFSVLQSYGVNGVKNNEGVEETEVGEEENEKEEQGEYLDGDFINKYNVRGHNDYNVINSANEQLREEPKKKEKKVIAKGIWKESFFFPEDDPRFNEALEFINKKDSTEATEAAENYGQMRKKLKEILRLHLKKQLLKKDPFKNKVGGMNKKQLSNSKFKNYKTVFNKRQPFRV